MRKLTGVTVPLIVALAPLARAEYKAVNPLVKKIVEEISEERIAENLKKLEGFGTRHTLSAQDHPTRGIGAARRWIFDQFRSYSQRLEVAFDQHRVKKAERLPRDVDLYNVVAVLPGTINRDQRIIMSGHYDSLAFERRPGAAPPAPGEQRPARDPDADAPGVTDDASGTACVMELARVLSQYQFEKTLVFIAFAGEENGLIGSRLYAANAKKDSHRIEAVLNNDIIGSVASGNGRVSNSRLSVFSEDPNDSPSRQLARYIKETGERYLPSMRVELIFRFDRFGRGGDHTPFNEQGYAAVRLSTPEENFAHQHSLTDTFANTSPPYIARVTRVNAAAAASLALAPKSPLVIEQIERGGRKMPSLMLTRGRTRYDAALRWKQESPEPDLAGFAIVARTTTAPFWERDIWVGTVSDYTLPDISIDEVVFGIKAVDKDGNESLVTPYVQPPRRREPIQTVPATPSELRP